LNNIFVPQVSKILFKVTIYVELQTTTAFEEKATPVG
jgi:hypothetical protein